MSNKSKYNATAFNVLYFFVSLYIIITAYFELSVSLTIGPSLGMMSEYNYISNSNQAVIFIKRQNYNFVVKLIIIVMLWVIINLVIFIIKKSIKPLNLRFEKTDIIISILNCAITLVVGSILTNNINECKNNSFNLYSILESTSSYYSWIYCLLIFILIEVLISTIIQLKYNQCKCLHFSIFIKLVPVVILLPYLYPA